MGLTVKAKHWSDLRRCTSGILFSSILPERCRQPAVRALSHSFRRRDKVSIDGRPHEVDGVFDARLDKDDDVFQEVKGMFFGNVSWLSCPFTAN